MHYLAGRLAYRRRDYEVAARAFHQAQELHPHWRARRWLGKSLSQLGRLEEAEATLLALLAEHPEVHLDLAWVYERREQPERAIKQVDAHLERCPDDDFAKAQRLRLKSRSLAPEDLIEEIQTLDDLGEDIPQDVLGTYVQRLLESGQGAAARSCVESRQERLDPRTALSVAWVCYRLKAYDLALGLFLRVVPQRLGDVKLLGALEAAAIRCHRVQEVIERYQPYLESEPRLYGRTRRLEKHVPAP